MLAIKIINLKNKHMTKQEQKDKAYAEYNAIEEPAYKEYQAKCNEIDEKEISKVKWRDGVIVLFEVYDSHTGEGGDEVFDSEISLLQKGIVLGSRVVGCDYELEENDFVNGLYEEGVDEDGGYNVYEYTKATLVEPEWLATSIAQDVAEERERLRGKIEKIKTLVQKQTGSFKYDSCYDDVISLLPTNTKREK